LLLSHGTPMIVSGDEILRTQRGNNNAYCQDNAISWFDWKLVERNEEMLRFCQAIIAFRKAQPTVRRETFLTGQPHKPGDLPDVSWYSPDGISMDWSRTTQSLICVFGTTGLETPAEKHDMLLMHPGTATQKFVIPTELRKLPWRMFVDTGAEAPRDVYPNADGPALPPKGELQLVHHSLQCYVA
jgi:isoamylase